MAKRTRRWPAPHSTHVHSGEADVATASRLTRTAVTMHGLRRIIRRLLGQSTSWPLGEPRPARPFQREHVCGMAR